MGNPRVGTVKYVIINEPSTDEFYWVTWEQFRMESASEAKWTNEVKRFETQEEARKFSLSL